MIAAGNGTVHRLEDWGRRQLRLPDRQGSQGTLRAAEHRVRPEDLAELTGAFRFSDAVLRHLVVSMEAAVTEPSPMATAEEEDEARRERDENGR